MDNNITEKLEFLKEKTKYFEKLTDNEILFDKVNNLINDKSYFEELLYSYQNDGTAVNFVRYMILKYIEDGISINSDVIDEIKNIYINADDNALKQILKEKFKFSDDMESKIISNRYNKKGKIKKNPFGSLWKFSFNFCYVFFYKDEDIKNKINKYSEDIGEYFLDKLNLEGYTSRIVDFHGTMANGQSSLGVYLYPSKLENYKNAIQFAFEIRNGEFYVYKCKGKNVKKEGIIDLKGKWVNTIDEVCQYFQEIKNTVIEENNILINEFEFNRSQTNYWWFSTNDDSSFRFYKSPIGEENFYTIKDNGEKRQKPKNFEEIKEGDKFVGYDGSPISCLVSVGEVTRKDEEKVYIKNTKIFNNQIHISCLQEQSDYDFDDCFGSAGTLNIGSLFKLTKEEFDYILKMGDKKVPDKISKNLILYGPPGTGKTYNTVVEAIKILDEKLYEEYAEIKEEKTKEKNKKYEELEKKFNKFKEDGQLEFVTFHQSYSYEEFVEGIKPYIPKSIWKAKNIDDVEKPDVKYIGKQGVFREICKRAEDPIMVDIEQFNNCYDKFIAKFKNNETTIKKDENDIAITINSANNLYVYSDTDTEKDPAGSIKPLHIITQKTDKQRTPYLKAITNHLVKNYGLEIKENKNNKNYVLIIDEINRGNISKIFGELITLIEEDKRGKLKVRLPYSQDEFTVPENLYIIGTMNTSDRSIASVDIALRRRFTFKEMMPKPDLVADFGCKFDDIYKILNKKITILADRDHQIGHSYFIKDKHEGENINDLQDIWFDSVLPLLNEYFYGDWEKLQEILGKAEKEEGKKEDDKYTSFIKKLTPCINDDNCYDKETDCFDFVKENEIDFEKALDNAFKKSLEKVFPDKYKTNNTTQGSVKENTEE